MMRQLVRAQATEETEAVVYSRLAEWTKETKNKNILKKIDGYLNERINVSFLQKHIGEFNQNFYVCGPHKMVDDLKQILQVLGAKTEAIVFEE